MNNTINCPYCGEEIPSSSTSCPYCGECLSQKRSENQFSEGLSPADHMSESPAQDSRSHITESDHGNNIFPKAVSERQETFKAGKLAAIIVAVSVVLGVTLGIVVVKMKVFARNDNISSAVYQSGDLLLIPTAKAKAPVPSATAVSSEATFYCDNTKETVAFDYGYEPYSYGDYILLSGDSGALGGYSGYNVVSYQKSTGAYNYVCFGAEVIVYPPLVISVGRRLVKEGDCEADNEYDYVYEYYSGTTNKQLTPEVYSGTLGKYRITVELAFDSVAPRVVGTLFYNRNGSDNRMYVYGDSSDDGSLVLLAYDPKFHDKPNETFFLNMNGSVLSGYWEKPRRDRLDVNLSLNR